MEKFYTNWRFINPNIEAWRLQGRRLYDVRKELCEQLNLKSIILGRNLDYYGKFKDEITLKFTVKKKKKFMILFYRFN
jgi:hypothetical protein